MRLFNKVAIVGTGLVGGSLALAIKNKGLAKEIVGVTRHKENLNIALRKGVIHKGSLDLEIIKGADLLILATPVGVILSQKDAIAKLIDKNCIVIDVGSTKSRIVAALQRVFPNFVGTHPLAGSEKKGIVFADGSLFDNSLCIITPTKKTSKAALGKVKRLWLQLKTKVAILSPEDHDSILSYTSHLPHAIAFSLIAAIPDKCLKFSAGGLKSSTRISASDAILWKDIFLSNRKNMLKAIKSFESGLTRIKSAINRNNSSALISILTQAKKKRDSLQ